MPISKVARKGAGLSGLLLGKAKLKPFDRTDISVSERVDEDRLCTQLVGVLVELKR
jgi:hypothetical protein